MKKHDFLGISTENPDFLEDISDLQCIHKVSTTIPDNSVSLKKIGCCFYFDSAKKEKNISATRRILLWYYVISIFSGS